MNRVARLLHPAQNP